jgi:hypothetical protein
VIRSASFVTVDQLRAVPATPRTASVKMPGKPYIPLGFRRLTTQQSCLDTPTRSSSSRASVIGSRGRRRGAPVRNTT